MHSFDGQFLAFALSLGTSRGMTKTLQRLKVLAADAEAVVCSRKRVSELTLSLLALPG